MGEPLVLTFDIGTQSIRAMLCDTHGDFPAYVSIRYETPYISDEPGRAEQEPDFYYDKLAEAGKQLKEKAGELYEDIVAVTVTTIRDTQMWLDKDRKPLRNTIVWMDKREAEFDLSAGFVKNTAFRYVGMEDTVKMQYRASFWNWVRQNEPSILKQTDKFVLLPTYINYKLTGVLKDAAANQIGHLPFDYKNRSWMKPNDLTRCVADIPTGKLARLVRSGSRIGLITAEAAEYTGIPEGLPLIATGSDKGCETLGLSVIKPGAAALSFGTTATVQLATQKYFEPQQFLPSYPAIPNDTWNPEIQIYYGYSMLRWFIREFAQEEQRIADEEGTCAEAVLNRSLADIPAGCNGLIVQPYWEPGVSIPNAKGTITGFNSFHTKHHLYRAIIEGINFALMEGLRMMEKRSHTPVKELFIAGGGAQSDEICQITADMFGLPVNRIHTYEASGLGSSMVAFISMGQFDDYEEAIASMVRVCDTFEPDEKTHEIYEDIYKNVYTKIYPKLEPVLKNIKKN